jgi:UDP-N-acetylmuramoyl-tripeptide--D-alanyl-D-alanine ligase
MLEMGEDANAYHAALAQPVARANADLVFTAGRHMQALWDVLPAARRGAHAATSAELLPRLLESLQPGDTVLVKGSNGAKMSVVIDALKAKGA